MTVYAYSGKNGAGKTSQVVEFVIVPALRRGRVVFHNLDLIEAVVWELVGEHKEGAKLVAFDREKTEPAELIKLAPSGALVIIDESWRYWRNGLVSSRVPQAEFEFFAMHRHSLDDAGNEMDIVLIQQDLAQLANFIRELVQITYVASKLTHVGSKNRYRVDTYDGAVKGDKPPESKRITSKVYKRNPVIFKAYRSHTKAPALVEGGQDIADGRANVFKSWKFRIAIVALLLVLPGALILVATSVHKFQRQVSGGKGPAAAEHSEGKDRPLSSPPNVAQAALVPAAPKLSATWRYGGMAVINSRVIWFLDSDHGPRTIDRGCTRDTAGEWTCKVDGEIVTAWSGPAPTLIEQFVGSTSASSVAR